MNIFGYGDFCGYFFFFWGGGGGVTTEAGYLWDHCMSFLRLRLYRI